jgi:succinoglycan biosynthesis protein ExoM
MEISVVIPTYRRAKHLMQTVTSCIEQKHVEGIFELIVVDNDIEGSARSTISTIAQQTKVPIIYIKEDRPGISWARNAGVAAANGPYLVFLDDDEIPTPEWLNALRTTIQSAGADIAVGPVIPCFPVPDAAVSHYAKKTYTRDAGLPSGTALKWGGIGNCILRRERCFTTRSPFDPRLGISGGEDAVFLHQALLRGCKLVWCAEAIVRETIPADKLTWPYLLKRAYRAGQTTTFVHLGTRPINIGLALRSIAIGCAQALVYAPVGGLLLIARRPRWLNAMAKAVQGFGKVVYHPSLHISLYRLKK